MIDLLIHPSRFDLIAKYLYIKAFDKKLDTNFFKILYYNHIITLNNCIELPDLTRNEKKISKNGINDFYNAFDLLINNLLSDGFDTNYPIPIGNNNIIINGSHRLMTCYYYNIIPKFIKINIPGNTGYNYKYFINNKYNPPLDHIYRDTIALEYIKHNKNIRCMIVYPVVYNHSKINELSNIIENYGYIYYSKVINLNNSGVDNLIKEAYRDEDWIGGLFPANSFGKTRFCLANNPTIYISICIKDLSKCIELKKKCRSLFGLDKHSLHMSDFTSDTYRISSCLLNDNSIHFLNYGTNLLSESTKTLLRNYFKNKIDEDYCLTSSLIMEMYNLRQAKDIDYLHKNNKKLNLQNICIHDDIWLSYYHVNKDEIIYNPNYHFYFNGFKFATLSVIKEMKHKRNEEKDIIDLKLINKIIV